MALTATGIPGARLEDLLAEAAAGLGLKRSGDLEDLALSLERSLDAAGSGLLVIFDAHLLSAPVIGELCELSGSDTESGLYMQVLLTGGPGLDAQFDKPGLANAARQVASSRWRIEGERAGRGGIAGARPTICRLRHVPHGREQPAFTRRRTRRPDEELAPEPAFEPPSASRRCRPAGQILRMPRPSGGKYPVNSTQPSRRKSTGCLPLASSSPSRRGS